MNTSGLLPYQVEHARKLLGHLQRERVAVDISDVGTGKMHVGAVLVRELGDRPTVVVCPKIICSTWEDAAREKGCSVTAINYELVRRGDTTLGGWRKSSGGQPYFNWCRDIDTVVFDECHRGKGDKSLNALLIAGAKICKKRILLASATPAVTPLDMRALGYVTGMHQWGNFSSWLRRHGCRYLMTQGWVFDGRRGHMRQLNEELGKVGSRIRIEDLVRQGLFPESRLLPSMYSAEDPAQLERLYVQMAEQLQALHEQRCKDRCPDEIQVKLLRTRQEIELLKVPVLVELCKDLIEQQKSVPIFVHFRATVKALLEQLKEFRPGWIIGAQRESERQGFIDDFQHGRTRVIVAIASAGGIGIGLHNVHGNYAREPLICLDWSVTTLDQVLGRSNRAGGKTPTTQRIVLLNCPSEKKIMRAIEAKGCNSRTLVDADLAPESFFGKFNDITLASVLGSDYGTTNDE